MNQEWFPNWFSHVDENWFSHVDELTPAQRKEVTAALSDQRSGEASLAAIELGGRCRACIIRNAGCPLARCWPMGRR